MRRSRSVEASRASFKKVLEEASKQRGGLSSFELVYSKLFQEKATRRVAAMEVIGLRKSSWIEEELREFSARLQADYAHAPCGVATVRSLRSAAAHVESWWMASVPGSVKGPAPWRWRQGHKIGSQWASRPHVKPPHDCAFAKCEWHVSLSLPPE